MSKRVNRLMDGLIVIVTLAAVVVGGIRIRRYVVAKQNEPGRPKRISQWQHFGAMGHRVGPTHPKVTIVEYADFQCPFCRNAEKTLRALRRQHPQDVALVYRHFPVHTLAVTAAAAAECASRTGAFQALHDRLYDQQDSIGAKPWARFALEVGVKDTASFSRCLYEPDVSRVIARDAASGDKLGVTGTPTFLINDLKVSGFVSAARFRNVVSQALDEAGQP